MGTVNLPRTGWTLGFLGNKEGDDGHIQAGVPWPDPRFIDNGDGTVTDNLTGLIWTKNAGTPMVGSYEPMQKRHWWSSAHKVLTAGSCAGGVMGWENAFNYVTCLNAVNHLGHNDWRLPNINELESLVIFGPSNRNPDLISPLRSVPQIFRNVGSLPFTGYWSSTTHAINSSFAWRINFTMGGLAEARWKAIKKPDPRACDSKVWPVRDGQSGAFRNAAIWATGQTQSRHSGDDGHIQAGVPWPYPRFIDNDDGTVTDNLTGLIWTKDGNVTENDQSLLWGSYKTWVGALKYVTSINSGSGTYGHNDWRLPNVKELRSLIDYSMHQCALSQGHPFINVQPDFYWSSSPYRSHDLAWVVNMKDGSWGLGRSLGMNHIANLSSARNKKNDDNRFCLWPVRAGIVGKPP